MAQSLWKTAWKFFKKLKIGSICISMLWTLPFSRLSCMRSLGCNDTCPCFCQSVQEAEAGGLQHSEILSKRTTHMIKNKITI